MKGSFNPSSFQFFLERYFPYNCHLFQHQKYISRALSFIEWKCTLTPKNLTLSKPFIMLPAPRNSQRQFQGDNSSVTTSPRIPSKIQTHRPFHATLKLPSTMKPRAQLPQDTSTSPREHSRSRLPISIGRNSINYGGVILSRYARYYVSVIIARKGKKWSSDERPVEDMPEPFWASRTEPLPGYQRARDRSLRGCM